MNRPTLGMIRSSSLPGNVGICAANISEVAAIVNEAQERLLHDPMAPDEGWWGGWARMQFTVSVGTNRYAYITTPREVARLIVMDVCERPVRIRNGFYEFLEFGIGLQPRPNSCQSGNVGVSCACTVQTQSYERENVATLSEQTISPATIRIYPTDASDVGRKITIQGLDQNGQAVTSVDTTTARTISGEVVTLQLPFTDTAAQFSRVTGIIKAVTIGMVTIDQVNPDTGDESVLTSMEPGETTAAYRRYLVNGLPLHCCNGPCGSVQITAMAKLDFIPVSSDSDYLTIMSIPAINEEVQAIRYSRMDAQNAPKLEEKHHAKALQLLFGQLDHFMGKTNTAIRVPIFGSDRVRLQPL